ncbi:MAG: thiamine phosphate synthase [Deltaproteobacteria bacterium]|nr:thiamine phosphate synthase [Deltaproteobacteria bacterium]
MSGKRDGFPTARIEALYGVLDPAVVTIAISGITRQNVREVIRAGASGFAVISDRFGGPAIQGRAKEFLRIWEEETGRR